MRLACHRAGGSRQLQLPTAVRAGGSGGNDHGLVIHYMVKEVGNAGYPFLTRTNYTDWAALMRVTLQAWVLYVTP